MKVNFEKNFNEETVHKVRDKMEMYLPALFAQDISLEIAEKSDKLWEYAYSMNSSKVIELLDNYDNIIYEDMLLQNWLAYQIGFFEGRKFEKNKKC